MLANWFSKIFISFNYLWRVVATSFSFILFGIGGLLISQLLVPLACLTIKDKKKRQVRAQNIIHFGFRLHINTMKFLGIMTTEIIGVEKLKSDKARLFLANHPTLIDVVLMLSLIPKTNCIVKEALFKNFFLRGVVSSAGYVSNSADPQRLIDDSVALLKDGQSLVVFPEGTRTSPGKKMKFQRAPARIAIEGNQAITPVIITCSPPALTKEKKWFQIPSKKFHIQMIIGDELSLNNIIDGQEAASLSTRKLTRYLEDYFQQEIIQYEHA